MNATFSGFLLALIVCVAGTNRLLASETNDFVRVPLGGSVTVEVPALWKILRGKQAATIELGARLAAEEAGLRSTEDVLLVASSDSPPLMAGLNITAVREPTTRYGDGSRATPAEIAAIGARFRSNTEGVLASQKATVRDWKGTTVESVAGQDVIVCRYTKLELGGFERFCQQHTFFFEGRILIVNTHCNAREAGFWNPVFNRCLTSLRDSSISGKPVPLRLDPDMLDVYLKKAGKGDASAQNALGGMYEQGIGVTKNSAQAVNWYRKAAEQGYSLAQQRLGVAYLEGEGVRKDDAEAVRWFLKAADQGNPAAQYALGICFEGGKGVQTSGVESLKWYRKAAENGLPEAQSVLGFMYSNGVGVSKDLGEAFKWYRKAALQSETTAQFSLAVLYIDGLGVPADAVEGYKWLVLADGNGLEAARQQRLKLEGRLTPTQRAEGQKRARAFVAE